MNNSNSVSRMPKSDKKSKKAPSKRRVLKRSGQGGKDDDDSSVDSRGNVRDLIDYDYTSEEDTHSSSRRPTRRAAIIAKKKINKVLEKKSKASKASKVAKQSKQSSKRLTPSKRKNPFSSKLKRKNHKRRSPISETSEETYSTEEDTGNDSMDEYTDRETETEETSVETEEDAEENEEDSDEIEEEDENEEEEEEAEYDEDDEDYDDEEEEDDEGKPSFGGILLTLGGAPAGNMKPKKYNLKKESENVNKFVKLLTNPVEENTIDKQIDQFKSLTEEQQKDLLVALEKRPTGKDTGVNLMLKILTLKLPTDVQAMVLAKYNSMQNLDTSSNEYFKLRAWLDKIVSIPFGTYKDIPVRLDDGPDRCAEFMKGAMKNLDEAVFGQEESKLQILQFISTKIANPASRGLSLLLVGSPGIGKTSLIKNGIAKALGWPFQFISLGGDSDASTYTGHQLVYESSHCGKIVNSLIASKSMSTVLMFDEVDKISQTPKGEEVMNLLIHLTDPVQNEGFEDKYLSGVPIDLSKVMFVFSANDINKIDKVLLDRMMVIDLKGYDLKQKTAIAEQYLLPSALKEVNLTEKISISKDILTHVIENYATEEKGVRELKRCIDQITQKINMLRMFNSPELPFHIKDFALPFIVKKEHIKLFLKKKENTSGPPMGMYL
jgi:ATP-dependent Lon protease